mgnify:CR=1 FL=1
MTRSILEYVILAGSSLCRTKTLGASRCITLLYVTGVRLGRESSVITDRRLPQFELRDQAELRRQRRRRRSRRAAERQAQRIRLAHQTLLASCLDSHTLTSIWCTCTHESTSDHEFTCACLAPRPRSARSIFACAILAGSLFPRSNLRTQLALYILVANLA